MFFKISLISNSSPSNTPTAFSGSCNLEITSAAIKTSVITDQEAQESKIIHDIQTCAAISILREDGILSLFYDISDLKSMAFSCEDVELVIAAFEKVGVKLPSAKPLLFIINPFGGTASAPKLFTSLEKILTATRTPYKSVSTTHKNHCAEYVREINVSVYAGIVACSGDGVFHELLDCVMQNSLDVVVGYVPCGSSNALAKNLGAADVLAALLPILKQTTTRMDVLKIYFQGSGVVVYTHLNLCFGVIADLDIESDAYRWLGREKTTLAALVRLVFLRKYRARIGVLPYTGSNPAPGEIAGWGMEKFPVIQWCNEPLAYFMAANLEYLSTEFRAAEYAKGGAGLCTGGVDVTYGFPTRFNILKCLLSNRVPRDTASMNLKNIKAFGFRIEPVGWSWDSAVWKSMTGKEFCRKGGNILAVSGEPFELQPIVCEVIEGGIGIFGLPKP